MHWPLIQAQLSELIHLPLATVLWTLAALFTALTIATGWVYHKIDRNPDHDYTELKQRIQSWWVIVSLFSLALVVHPLMALGFFAFVSFLAFREYLSLIPTRNADRRVILLAYLGIAIQYCWIGVNWYVMFLIFIPIYMFLLLPMRMVLMGETQGFLRAIGTLHWGLMLTVFCLGHMAYLLMLPGENNPIAGSAGLLLFLVLLTECNDIAQYIWGKCFGVEKVLPTVSPGKTWAGLIGGVITTMGLAFLLAPWLTPFDHLHSLLVGLLIGLAGFIGDVTVSALKRDLGVKDSGQLIPGHGGILDRLDSLTYTAPLFFHFTVYFYFPGFFGTVM
jgi:phosphatidate cytidylyltransferase